MGIMFHKKWKLILKKSWAVKFAVVSGFFTGLELILPLFATNMPKGLFAGLSLICTIGAVVSRVILQQELHNGNDK